MMSTSLRHLASAVKHLSETPKVCRSRSLCVSSASRWAARVSNAARQPPQASPLLVLQRAKCVHTVHGYEPFAAPLVTPALILGTRVRALAIEAPGELVVLLGGL